MLYFHHDNRLFKEGDIIKGNHYDIDDDILEAYSKFLTLDSIQDMLYMTTYMKDSWEYDHCYRVETDCAVFKYLTNYSPVLCQQEYERSLIYFKRHVADESEESIRSEYIRLMRNAYSGDTDAAYYLGNLFGYIPDEYAQFEYVTQYAKVVDVYEDYHVGSDTSVPASILIPVMNKIIERQNHLESEGNESAAHELGSIVNYISELLI